MCAALPTCYCARSGVRRSLPDLVCGQSVTATLVEPNTIVTGVQHSLPVTAQDQVCGTPCLTCGRALVCGQSLPVSVSRTNTLATGVQRSLPAAV
jgi:hypothetical protein